jgi:UDP-glucose 4-epimerase
MSKLLVTGGAGYIGSHTVVALQERGDDVVVLDNLCNSKKDVLARIADITGKVPVFIEGDIRDRDCLRRILAEHAIDAVIHFAGLKAVGEGEQKPLEYYDNNVVGSLVLFEEMRRADVNTLIFSSSATVYGDKNQPPLREEMPVSAANVYGRTKLMIEDMLRDIHRATGFRVALLRYFNPVGAHASGLIGESPNGVPNNLMPFVAQVASGQREKVFVFGNDYPTPDGTGVRDYLHVEDLALAHLKAFDALRHETFLTVNLGTGQGYSVLDLIHAFERAADKTIPYEIVARRPGDVAICYADPAYAEKALGWKARYDLDRMCEDAWRYVRAESVKCKG